MIIKEFNDFQNLRPIKDQWDALAKSENPEQWFFFSYDWYKNWWEAFGKKGRPILLCVYDGQDLIGMAAFFERKKFYLGVYAAVISLMANPHSPKNSIIYKVGSPNVIDIIMEYIISKYQHRFIYLEDISQNDPAYAQIIEICKTKRLDYHERSARVSLGISFNASWAEFMATRSINLRNKINKVERKIQATDNYKYVHFGKEEDLKKCFADIQIISQKSWQGWKGTSFAADRTLYRLYYNLASIAAEKGLLDIVILYLWDRPAAYIYHIVINNTIYCLKKEYSQSFSKYSPGFCLDAAVFRTACENNMRLVDLLGFKTQDKERWANVVTKDARIYIYQSIAAKIIKFIDFNLRTATKGIIGKTNG